MSVVLTDLAEGVHQMLPVLLSRVCESSRILPIAMVALLISGCGDGKTYEHVSYDPPIVERPDAAVNVPDGQAGAPPGDAAAFTSPVAVKPNGVVVFTGRFRPKEPGKVMPLVVYFNARIAADGSRGNFASAIAIPKKEKDGYWSYRAQIAAPQEPRQYNVDVMHAGDLVATGKVNVE